jgi:hypothetical protein
MRFVLLWDFNLFSGVAPEWAGFEIGWLSKRILQKNRFGRSLLTKFLHPLANHWWKKLSVEIERARQEQPAREKATTSESEFAWVRLPLSDPPIPF